MSLFRDLCVEYVGALTKGVVSVGDVCHLLENSKGSDQEKKTCLDVAFRKALLNKVNFLFYKVDVLFE